MVSWTNENIEHLKSFDKVINILRHHRVPFGFLVAEMEEGNFNLFTFESSNASYLFAFSKVAIHCFIFLL